MKTNKNYNPLRIQEYLFKLFDNKVSNQTYMTNIPTFLSSASADTDFMVIGLPQPLVDLDAYGHIKTRIEIFVKSNDRGQQDNSKLRDMYDQLMTVVDGEDEHNTDTFILCKTREGTYIDYDEKQRYHILITFLTIIIKQ